MKYRSKVYAKALVESLLDKKADENKIKNNFIKLLEKNGDTKKAKEIITLAEKLLLQKMGNKKLVIETARKVDNKDFLKKFTKKGDIVQEKINSQLIAGLKVIVNNDRQLDLSLAKKLENIF